MKNHCTFRLVMVNTDKQALADNLARLSLLVRQGVTEEALGDNDIWQVEWFSPVGETPEDFLERERKSFSGE